MKNLFLLITLYLLVSCSKTTNVVPEFETASFYGTVECYDEFNKRIDNKGVKVEIEDLPQFSSVTNNSGFFQIKEIPIGTYSFSFFKEGFGKYFLDRYTLIGGIQPVYYYDAKIYKPVDILLLDHTIYYENNSKSVIAKGNVNVSTPYSIYLGYKTSLTDDFVRFFIIYWSIMSCVKKMRQHYIRLILSRMRYRNLSSHRLILLTALLQRIVELFILYPMRIIIFWVILRDR